MSGVGLDVVENEWVVAEGSGKRLLRSSKWQGRAERGLISGGKWLVRGGIWILRGVNWLGRCGRWLLRGRMWHWIDMTFLIRSGSIMYRGPSSRLVDALQNHLNCDNS